MTDNFREVLLSIAAIAELSEVRLRPFRDSRLTVFEGLSLLAQQDVLRAAQSYLSVCQKSQVKQGAIDPKMFVWNGIKALGLRPTSNCFDLLDSEDIVEIHNFEARQLFRNLNYFRYSSYDLETLFCRDISELFEYDQETLNFLMSWFRDVASGEWNTMRPFHFRPFQIRESQSAFRFDLEVQVLWGGPLFDSSGHPAATIAFDRAKILNSELPLTDQPTSLEAAKELL